MPSTKLHRLPRPFHRQPVPPRYAVRSYPRSDAGFGLLLIVTLLAAFCYLTGTASVARHDALSAAFLVAVWGLYFFHDTLLQTRVGPLLVRAGQLLLIASVTGFFGFVLWLVLSHP